MKLQKWIPLLLAVLLMMTGCSQLKKLPTKPSAALDEAVTQAILAQNAGIYRGGECKTESHTVLGIAEQENQVTVYAVVLYLEYEAKATGGYRLGSGGQTAAALTFAHTDSGYTLTEYWKPADTQSADAAVTEKFPESIREEALRLEDYIDGQQAECSGKAEAYFATRPDDLVMV